MDVPKLTVPPAPFSLVSNERDVVDSHVAGIISGTMYNIVEQGMSELHRGFKHAMEYSISQMEDMYKVEFEKRVAEYRASNTDISEDKMERIKSVFTAQVEARFKEKERTFVQPLRDKISKLRSELEKQKTDLDAARKKNQILAQKLKEKGPDVSEHEMKLQAKILDLKKIVKRQKQMIDVMSKPMAEEEEPSGNEEEEEEEELEEAPSAEQEQVEEEEEEEEKDI